MTATDERERPVRVSLFGASGRMGRAIIAAIASESAGWTLVNAFCPPDDPDRGRDAGDVAGVGFIEVALRTASGPLGGSGGEESGVMMRSLGHAEPAPSDVVIDFSSPEGCQVAIEHCRATGTPLVSGTTGLPSLVEASLDRLAERLPVVHAPNMSVGVMSLFFLAERAAKILGAGWDAEIVEMHHRHKIDAPSGTAARLAEHVAKAKGLEPRARGTFRYGREGQVGPRGRDEIGVMTLRGGSVVGEHTLILASESERIELTHRAEDRSVFAFGALRAAGWVIGREPGRYDMGDVLGIAAPR